jgi:hypothetical protein
VVAGGAFAWWRDRTGTERRLDDERAEAKRLQLDGARTAAEDRAALEAGFKAQQARAGIDANVALATALRAPQL